MSDSVRPHRWQPTRVPRSWDSPGKNTGVGCNFLLQCIKVKNESELAQLCLTLRPHRLQPTRIHHPWDFPGKCTGVGCRCLPFPKRKGGWWTKTQDNYYFKTILHTKLVFWEASLPTSQSASILIKIIIPCSKTHLPIYWLVVRFNFSLSSWLSNIPYPNPTQKIKGPQSTRFNPPRRQYIYIFYLIKVIEQQLCAQPSEYSSEQGQLSVLMS